MGLTILQVDAFTNQPFAGNPAAVCVLPEPQPEAWMQAIAQEMNLSETAFLLHQGDRFNLRWFTPTTEVNLCGHATLASAHVLWSEGHLAHGTPAQFHTRSGILTATQQGDWIELDFPAIASEPTTAPPILLEALNIPILQVRQNADDYIVTTESAAIVRQMQPNFSLLRTLPMNGVIVTSQAMGFDVDGSGAEFDFVSRYFAPNLGINEDPVTGYAHCCLAPYWKEQLQKPEFLAYQASARGGVVKVKVVRDRVRLAGQAVTVMRGELI